MNYFQCESPSSSRFSEQQQQQKAGWEEEQWRQQQQQQQRNTCASSGDAYRCQPALPKHPSLTSSDLHSKTSDSLPCLAFFHSSFLSSFPFVCLLSFPGRAFVYSVFDLPSESGFEHMWLRRKCRFLRGGLVMFVISSLWLSQFYQNGPFDGKHTTVCFSAWRY